MDNNTEAKTQIKGYPEDELRSNVLVHIGVLGSQVVVGLFDYR